ncbi:hypothetical protein SDC9_209038 [bioreactor metagenome]|uniref:Uncharacterized protein n=1 Tax=bioreactor metagenome TaxID=1076179 RepID=A0A645JNZ1_9ZZZZ
MRLHGLLIEVGHQAALELDKEPRHIAGFLIEQPGHPVACGTVEPAVGGQKPESHPALVHIRRGRLLKARDIMAPKTETAVGQ